MLKKSSNVISNSEITWLALGIALTTATQLRTSSPVGPGEVMVAGWLLFVSNRLLLYKSNSVPKITKIMFWFWLICLSSISIGFLIAESLGLAAVDAEIYHDTIALIFSFSFCIAFSMSIRSKKQLQKLLIIIISVITSSQVVMALFAPLLGSFTPWYGGARFRGWSNDPNQLALLVSTIPFFCIYLLNLSKKTSEKFYYVLLIIVAIIVGVGTGSDSLRLWWAVGILILIFLKLYENFSKTVTTRLSPYRAFISKQIIFLILIFTRLLIGYFSYEKVSAVLTQVYNYGSQGNFRLNLWINGIAAVLFSPIFGLGPGPHSGLTGPFLNWEAHNSFIDWAGTSGIIGLICYVTLIGWIGWNAWKNRSAPLLAALISLVGYGVFLYTLRHIVFWFYLLTIAILSSQSVNQK